MGNDWFYEYFINELKAIGSHSKCADGKSAYDYAVESGYTGTEAEFAEKLAAETLLVTITDNNGTLSADKTFTEIRDAILSGTTVLADYDGIALPLIALADDFMWFGAILCGNDEAGAAYAQTVIIEMTENGEVNDISASILGAKEPLIGSIDDIKPSQVYMAVEAGRPVILGSGFLTYTAFSASPFLICSSIIFDDVIYWLRSDVDNDTWIEGNTKIPTTLPNPNALTFTGAVTGSYDGSTAKTVNIPSTVTDEHINELINTALSRIGVAEEGAY